MAQLRNKKKSFQRILIRITFLSTKKLFLYFKYDLRIVPITFVKSLIRLFLTSKIESKFQLSQFGNFRIRESENSDSLILRSTKTTTTKKNPNWPNFLPSPPTISFHLSRQRIAFGSHTAGSTDIIPVHPLRARCAVRITYELFPGRGFSTTKRSPTSTRLRKFPRPELRPPRTAAPFYDIAVHRCCWGTRGWNNNEGRRFDS